MIRLLVCLCQYEVSFNGWIACKLAHLEKVPVSTQTAVKYHFPLDDGALRDKNYGKAGETNVIP